MGSDQPQRYSKKNVLLAIALALFMCTKTDAGIILNAIKTGSYTSDAYFATPTYLTGIYFSYGPESRGLVVFDFSSVTPGILVSATLSLENPYSDNQLTGSPDLEVRLYGVPSLDTSNVGIANTYSSIHSSNFSLIGSNLTTQYSTAMVPVHPSGTPNSTPVVFNLNAAALTEIQSALGVDNYFGFGMKIVKADVQEPKPLQYAFDGTALGGTVTLELNFAPTGPTSSVPEPASLAMLGALLATLGGGSVTRRLFAACSVS